MGLSLVCAEPQWWSRLQGPGWRRGGEEEDKRSWSWLGKARSRAHVAADVAESHQRQRQPQEEGATRVRSRQIGRSRNQDALALFMHGMTRHMGCQRPSKTRRRGVSTPRHRTPSSHSPRTVVLPVVSAPMHPLFANPGLVVQKKLDCHDWTFPPSLAFLKSPPSPSMLAHA